VFGALQVVAISRWRLRVVRGEETVGNQVFRVGGKASSKVSTVIFGIRGAGG
jgi:hypothetical protein